MRFLVGKLIRDELPKIMRAQGLSVFDRRLDDAEFLSALKAKLVEEALEAQAADSLDELASELADLSEVMQALMAATGLASDTVEQRRLEKRAERGGFDARVFNAAVEAPEGLPAADYYLARPSQYPQVPPPD